MPDYLSESIFTDDGDEWITAREWAVTTLMLQRRSKMLECMLPFASGPDNDTLATVGQIQRHFRGFLVRKRERSRARCQRHMRNSFARWHMHSERARAAEQIRMHVIHIYHATLIQRYFRRFLRWWDRPRVSILLRRVQLLENQLVDERTRVCTRCSSARKRQKKARTTILEIGLPITRGCQTDAVNPR